MNDLIPYKYREGEILAELEAYVKNTYKSHYVGEDNIQALDLIFAAGHGEGFCIGDILKYAARYGKKNGYNRKDLMKILHYALLLVYLHDKEHMVKPVEDTPVQQANEIGQVPDSQQVYPRLLEKRERDFYKFWSEDGGNQ